ncbi:glycoside hydrolase 5 family protein [Marinigracilibium pacificum]|uniref:mannan endo-1,4-beta-mannosidase n=1 Tax=Marinigracilibium pacificum TaxID=2729599 RepID=A0A848J439_9BACT|nr:hypothetical protein [Marinigracilibium pacificum]NMM49290.1 hypothetical protein [Marinigracilibium pacificum]
MKFSLFFFFILLSVPAYSQGGDFVRIESGHFYKGDMMYKFIGANYWYGMYLGMDSTPGDRNRLIRELDYLKSLGIKNLRILGSSEGSGKYQISPPLLVSEEEYNENVFKGLDFFLNELRKRDMTAVVVLNNFWMWSGGMPQYVSWVEGSEIPMPDIENGGNWDNFINYSLSFYENNKAQRLFKEHLKMMVNRVNTFNNLKYRDDPTILSWQLANEPRGYDKQKKYQKWIKKTSGFLKRIDNNHMVSLGAEGDGGYERDGIDLYRDNRYDAIDYATIHLWIQNWGWFNPENPETFNEALLRSNKYFEKQLHKAIKLKKPVVIEEFGVSRDHGDFSINSTTKFRDQFYKYVFDFAIQNINENGPIQGCNFWSWGGEGKPSEPGGMWNINSELIGDPPHERQGWYSVYNHDSTTINLIKESAYKLNGILK